MRNLTIGLGITGALIAGLFAALYFRAHPGDRAETASGMTTPAQLVAQIKPDFVGNQRIGNWKLDCVKGMELPALPLPHKSKKAPAGAEQIPPHWKIPRCRIFLGVANPKAPNEEIRVTIREHGFKRTLAVFLRFPPEEVSVSGVATLRIDQTEKPIAVRSCAKAFCLAVESIRRAEEQALVNAKTMTLKYTSKVAKKNVAILVPTEGLGDAISAIRRIDK